MEKDQILSFVHALSCMFVECMRTIHTDAYHSKHLGASLEEMFVSFAVHIGTFENQPMSASKIAGYLGLPRTNVLRALAALKEKNVVYSVGTVYLTNVDRLSKRVTPALMKRQVKTIARTWAAIAKFEASI